MCPGTENILRCIKSCSASWLMGGRSQLKFCLQSCPLQPCPPSGKAQTTCWQLSRSYQGDWSTCPVSKGWGSWSGSAWRRNNIEGTWKQLVHQSIQRGLVGEKNYSRCKGQEERLFRLALRKTFFSTLAAKQLSLFSKQGGLVNVLFFQDLTGQSWE